jgi:hypothetical protein
VNHATIIALAGLGAAWTSQMMLAAAPDQTPVVYRLGDGSTYQQGCFDPCLCPIMVEVGVTGTFTLTQIDSDPMRKAFDVADVNWSVALGDSDLHITGKGQYFVGQKDVPVQRLQLELVLGDAAEPTKFDSGWQEVDPKSFPHLNIGVSINNWFCWDTSIVIDAKPAPKASKIAMKLLDDSTYVYGCFAPCMCPLFMGPPLTGTFSLVELVNKGTYQQYAVVDVDWKVIGDNGQVLHTWTGSGTYTLFSEFASTAHLALDLHVDGSDATTHFDSGVQVTETVFPEINIPVSVNGMVCFDTVLTVHAKPRATKAIRPAPNPLPQHVAPSSETTTGAVPSAAR